MQSERLEARGPGGEILHVEFLWRGDRYAHVISVVEVDGTARPQWESVEGAAQDAWPYSPPFQSVRVEQLADGRRAALLVGSAGSSHWSASVEPAPGEAKLVFDVACRHPPPATWLGSSYRECDDSARLVEIYAEIIKKSGQGRRLISIQPIETPSRGTTSRWIYQIRLRLTPGS